MTIPTSKLPELSDRTAARPLILANADKYLDHDLHTSVSRVLPCFQLSAILRNASNPNISGPSFCVPLPIILPAVHCSQFCREYLHITWALGNLTAFLAKSLLQEQHRRHTCAACTSLPMHRARLHGGMGLAQGLMPLLMSIQGV